MNRIAVPLLGACVVTLASCITDPPGPSLDRDAVAGLWILTSVNRQPLPFVQPLAPEHTVTGGWIELRNDRPGRLVDCYPPDTVQGTVRRSDHVSDVGYNVNGYALTLYLLNGFGAQDNGTLSGSSVGSTLTVGRDSEEVGRAYTYRKVSDEAGAAQLDCLAPDQGSGSG